MGNRRRWVGWAVGALMAMGVFIGTICLSIVNETISKIGARHLESALERFTGGSARVETGAIPKTLPAPPQAAAAEQPPCISESPATIVAKLKKNPSQIARYKGSCVSWLVVLEAEPQAVSQTGVWTLPASPPSPPTASRCATLFCDTPTVTDSRLQIEARTIPGGLRGDERVRVIGKIAEYVPGGWFNPGGTLKLIEARVTRGGAPSP